jgi:hypothetical protein
MFRYLAFFVLFLPFVLMAGKAGPLSPLLDDERLISWGLDRQVLEVGYVGEGEVSHQVRVSAINGILNHRMDCLNVMENISRMHGGVNVHFVFWNSEGWTEDMFKAFFSKVGVLSERAVELSNLWKRLIEEMGGVESGGAILHFAHSIGATETYAAAALMKPEELSMVHVVALGPATIIHPVGFGSVMNYISKRDAIGVLDPWHFIRAIGGSYPYVSFIGEFKPFSTEHTLYEGSSYLKVIEDYGRSFQENFIH